MRVAPRSPASSCGRAHALAPAAEREVRRERALLAARSRPRARRARRRAAARGPAAAARPRATARAARRARGTSRGRPTRASNGGHARGGRARAAARASRAAAGVLEPRKRRVRCTPSRTHQPQASERPKRVCSSAIASRSRGSSSSATKARMLLVRRQSGRQAQQATAQHLERDLRRLLAHQLAAAREEVLPHARPGRPARRHVDEADRLLGRAAVRAGDAGDRDARRPYAPRPGRPLAIAAATSSETAPFASTSDGAHPERLDLGLVGVGHDRALEHGARTGDLGEPRRQQAARARLRERERQLPLAKQVHAPPAAARGRPG